MSSCNAEIFPLNDALQPAPPELIDYPPSPTTLSSSEIKYVTSTFDDFIKESPVITSRARPKSTVTVQPVYPSPTQAPQNWWSQEFINSIGACKTPEEIRSVVLRYCPGGTLVWDPVAFIKGFFNDKLMPLCDPKVPKALSAIFTQGLCSNLDWWRMGGPLNCQVHQVRRAQNGAICEAPRQVSPPYSLMCSSCIYPYIQLPTYSKTQTGVIFSYLDYFETLKWAYTNPYMPAKKVAILNMGNNKGFGGGWDIGYGGLESDIFMRTNISTSLGTFSNYQRPGPFECVYTKGVTLLRAGINEGYKFLDDGERMMFEVVTAYAYDNSKHCVPQKVDNDPTVYQVAAALNFDDEKKYVYLVTYNKISNVLTACLNNEVDTVILGALGCGYFQNPPDAVAAAFCCAIGNFTGNFDNIYISLIDEKVKEAFKQVALRYFPSLCYLEKNKEGKYCLTQLNKQDPSKNTSYQYN